MDERVFSQAIEDELSKLFVDHSGIDEREDSRAFGAMIERRITDNWESVCENLGYPATPKPGRRTIYDFGIDMPTRIAGVDVKTKDLDSDKYSDGGICSVGNLLKFVINDGGLFLVCEVGHKSYGKGTRDIKYIKVCPFISLPIDACRIENLGTGQIRLNNTLEEIWDRIDWNRSPHTFCESFIGLAVQHYEKVSETAIKRIASFEKFRTNKFEHFGFNIR